MIAFASSGSQQTNETSIEILIWNHFRPPTRGHHPLLLPQHRPAGAPEAGLPWADSTVQAADRKRKRLAAAQQGAGEGPGQVQVLHQHQHPQLGAHHQHAGGR